MSPKSVFLTCLVLATSVCFSSRQVEAKTCYFMTVFGSQCRPIKGSRIHTFATFFKATGEGNDWSRYQLEAHTISWLPVDMEMNILRLIPEEGDNFGLYETLDWAMEENAKIEKWGPYQITPEAYHRALHRIGMLQHDQITYQAVDPIFRTDVSNCIHAVSGIDYKNPRIRYPLIWIGISASHHIVHVFHENGLIINPKRDHTWIDRRIGLQCYPIETRPFKDHALSLGPWESPDFLKERKSDDIHFSVCPDFVVPPMSNRCPRPGQYSKQ